MRELFRGWRRKIGVLMLVTALALLGGWVRSLAVTDIVSFAVGKSTLVIGASVERSIVIGLFHSSPSVPLSTYSNWTTSDSVQLIDFCEDLFFSADGSNWVHLSWYRNGRRISKVTDVSGRRLDIWAIPYWSIVLPLTAISTFLLLLNPRRSPPRKIPDPIANEGTTS